MSSTVVIDCGSKFFKAGCGNYNPQPSSVFPSIVGHLRNPDHAAIFNASKSYYIGDEAQAKRGILSLKYPIENGIMTNLDCMQQILEYTFENELKINDTSECKVLLTEKCYNTMENRSKTMEMMFETFDVSSLYIGLQSTLSLYASGRIDGVIVDCGYDCINIVPIYQGLAIKRSNKRLNVGGKQLTDYLLKILTNRGYCFTTTAEREIVVQMKQDLCYVSQKHEDEWSDSPNVCNIQYIVFMHYMLYFHCCFFLYLVFDTDCVKFFFVFGYNCEYNWHILFCMSKT